MYGNSVDFKKIIRKARDYPDLASWKNGDPQSYAVAEKYNILDRHEVCRHMLPDALARVSWQDVVRDIPRHKTLASWRRSAPIFYWKCMHEGWMTRPEVTERFGRSPTLKDITLAQVLQHLDTHGSLEAWSGADPATYEQAKKKGFLSSRQVLKRKAWSGLTPDQLMLEILEDERLLLQREDLASIAGRDVADRFIQEQISKRVVVEIDHGILVKSRILEHDLTEARLLISAAVIHELHWNVVPCCRTRAAEFGLPPKGGRVFGLETEHKSKSIDLGSLFKGRYRQPACIEIARTTSQRQRMDQTLVGRIARALMGTQARDLEIATVKLLSPLSGSQLIDLRRMTRDVTPAVAAAIRKQID